ncbi:peptidoglycan-binding protein [Agrobacterium sp. S2/73]|uniref:glycoside hydrolase family protein n=1 Tax=unclassified Agrobacterium TaxID=2632611 RepID=UPI001ADD486A|nr:MULTISPECIES: peptidoglycan-binding protein [unclassified Agrobacterium]MBO9108883.1 peptidoglycan-binding protein [Agrobacterium sp. S2/73]QXZ73366.1 peptidoglycan-binding protein [Agrobacterium sp. S7/73]
MPITKISTQGRAFVRLHEGNPLTCYLDPVGIPTIGTGFTMRSDSVRRELAKIGITKLVPGKTKITAAQSDVILDAVLAAEYVPAVVAGSPNDRKQHELDAAASVTFNLGVGAMNWTWADLWRKGQIKKAAAHLASNYNTAKGKKLPGLVRRRKEEALLFEKGIYTGVGVTKEVTAEPPVLPDPVVKEAQELLTTAGLNPGAIDGWMGEKTKAAVVAYQKAHPHLIADGIIGPATIAQLRRDAGAAKDVVTKGASSAACSGLLAFTAGLPWGWIAAGVLVAVVGYVAYRNRDVIARRWNNWRGKEVKV